MGKARIRTQMSAGHTRRAARPGHRGIHRRRPRTRRHPLTPGRRTHTDRGATRAAGASKHEGTGQGEGRTRHLDGRNPGAQGRPQRRADQGRARPRSAAPTCTSTCGTSGRRRRSRCRWPSATSTWARSSSMGSEVQGFKLGDRVSGEGHITCGYCRNCRAGRRHLCRNTVGRRRQPPGLLRRVPRDPGVQRVQAQRRDHRRRGLDPRSVRQRHAHGAVVQPGRRGRADHGRRPDRHHGRRDRAPRRRAPHRDHRRQRLPARPRAQDGRDAGRST